MCHDVTSISLAISIVFPKLDFAKYRLYVIKNKGIEFHFGKIAKGRQKYVIIILYILYQKYTQERSLTLHLGYSSAGVGLFHPRRGGMQTRADRSHTSAIMRAALAGVLFFR